MIKGTTKSGFAFEIDETAVNDMRVIDAMVEVESGNLGGVSKLISLIFDKDQKKALYAFCADEKGRVNIDMCTKIAFEVLEFDGETKNLSPLPE